MDRTNVQPDPKTYWYWGEYGPFSRSPWEKQLFAAWGVLALLGVVGVGQRLIQGHMPAGYGSYVPWGLWIGIYFHAVGIATGGFLVGSLGYLFGWHGLGTPSMLRTVIALAVAGMLPAFIAVGLDLGHMERAHRILTSPNFSSMLTFNAFMYGAFVSVGVACWFLSFRRDSEWLKPLLVLASVFAVMIPSQSGAFLGVVHAKPSWNSALLPVLFLSSAVMAGSATLLVARFLLGPDAFSSTVPDPHAEHDDAIDRLRIVVAAAVVVYLVLEWAEFSLTLWSPAHSESAVALVMTGPYWWVFWIVHLAAGSALSLLLLLASRRRAAWALGALLVAVTSLSARLNVLIPGQASPEMKGLDSAFHHWRLSYAYHATLMEYLVGCFCVAVGMAVFFFVRRFGAVVAFRLSHPKLAENSEVQS